MAAILGEREIISSRELDYPRELVFRAWTTPGLLARWWGPHGFTNTFHECRIAPGGVWKFTMHGPNGADYPNESVFVEVAAPERIVLDHLSGHRFRVTATLDDLGGRTGLTFRQSFEVQTEFDDAKAYCVEGNEQNFDRLEQVLAEIAS